VIPLLFLLVFGILLWFWFRALLNDRWHTAGWFAGTAVLLLVVTGVIYLFGAWSGGLDVGEACAADGEIYDGDYRAANIGEFNQWFPLENKCNAGYDLVPGWVNPTLVVLAVLIVACLGYALRLAVARPPAPENQRTGGH
jgi:hypothetical protein